MRIKNLPTIAAQWVTRVTASGPQYKAGIQNPREDWATATVNAKDNYAAGIQAALSNDSFSKGVQKAGTAKWSARTLTIGAPRWIQGVTAGHSAYGNGFAKYHQVIAGLVLPPRGPAGSPVNIERVRVITEALHAAKLAGGA